MEGPMPYVAHLSEVAYIGLKIFYIFDVIASPMLFASATLSTLCRTLIFLTGFFGGVGEVLHAFDKCGGIVLGFHGGISHGIVAAVGHRCFLGGRRDALGDMDSVCR